MAKKAQAEVETAEMPSEELDVLELDQNLEDYPEPELLPQGIYKAELQGVEVKENQEGTGRYYEIEFVIPPDNFPANFDVDNYPDGKKLYYRLIRVPRSGDRRSVSNLRKFMQKLDLPTNTNVVDPNVWLGRNVKLKLIHQEYPKGSGQKNESIALGGIEKAD